MAGQETTHFDEKLVPHWLESCSIWIRKSLRPAGAAKLREVKTFISIFWLTKILPKY
jgi:hypothetical protein